MYIDEWEWDDGNTEELARHRLSPELVEQIAAERPKFRPNKAGRAATHAMVGADRGGRFWVICIPQIPGRPGLWRAVTGWAADKAEIAWYRRKS